MERRLKCECGNEIVVQPGSQVTSLDCPACGRELPVPAEPPAERKPCPFCLEPIHPLARKCPCCQEYLDSDLRATQEPQPPTSGLAVASLVLGVLSPVFLFLTAPLAIVTGVVALLVTRGGRARGRALAVVGLVAGVVCTLVLATLVALVWMAPDAPSVGLASPGEPLF